MKTLLFSLFSTLFSTLAFCQTTLKGRVTDEKGKGLSGANVSLKNSYDGASSNAEGNFQFKTTEKGEQVISCSFIGYETYNQKVILNNNETTLTLKPRKKYLAFSFSWAECPKAKAPTKPPRTTRPISTLSKAVSRWA